MPRIVTLLTDFGTSDGYVGEMKGVLMSGAPDCVVTDIAHDLVPQDVEAGRLALARYWRRFPTGTIHVAVIDPGVGGTRVALAVESEGRFLVGPDNGILSPAMLHPGARCVSLRVPPGASATFHGRDVFAPAAVRLASGMSLDALGSPHEDPVLLRTPESIRDANGVTHGVVLGADRFGNILTNLVARRGASVEIAGRVLPVARSYVDVASGELSALTGSSGLLEIALRDGNAATLLGAQRGQPVLLRHREL
ncbi:MAG TPA: SAM-dependent chlorinase/fluorinase [Gemmatimonadaceae bacterium]